MTDLLYSALPEPRRKIIFIHPGLTVFQCCQMMVEYDIGALVITDDDNLLGIASERDIVRGCLCKGLDPSKATVMDIACADVTILDLHDPLEKAMQAMTETKRRHVLVQDKGEIIAILSIGDLLYHILENKARMIEQLENYIHTY